VLCLLQTLTRFPADSLRRRIWRQILRMRLFQLLQLAQKLVVFGIGDLRPVEHIIEVFVALNLFPKPLDILLNRFLHGQNL
jgi:hypothetical protein